MSYIEKPRKRSTLETFHEEGYSMKDSLEFMSKIKKEEALLQRELPGTIGSGYIASFSFLLCPNSFINIIVL